MMPDRMVRDELLTSERYWGCSPEARVLYVSILLCADDAARFTGSNFALRTKCMAGSVDSERIEKLLTELVDCDLIRAYQSDGTRFLFVPRFRQRKRYTAKSKYPEPPKGISDLTEKKTDLSRTKDALKSDSSQSQDERREEKRREEILTSPNGDVVETAVSPACPQQEIIALYNHHLPSGTQVRPKLWSGARAKALQARWREDADRQNPEWWSKFFSYCAQSRFLTGQAATPGRDPFVVSLDWILKPANFTKIIEGFYHREAA